MLVPRAIAKSSPLSPSHADQPQHFLIFRIEPTQSRQYGMSVRARRLPLHALRLPLPSVSEPSGVPQIEQCSPPSGVPPRTATPGGC